MPPPHLPPPHPPPSALASEVSQAVGAWSSTWSWLVVAGDGPPTLYRSAPDFYALTVGLDLPGAPALAVVADGTAPDGVPGRDVWVAGRRPGALADAFRVDRPAFPDRVTPVRRRADLLVTATLHRAMGVAGRWPVPSWRAWLGQLWMAMAAELVTTATGTPTDATIVTLSSHPVVALEDRIAADPEAPGPPGPLNAALVAWLAEAGWEWMLATEACAQEPLVPPGWAAWAGLDLSALAYADSLSSDPALARHRLRALGRADVADSVEMAARGLDWDPCS